MPDAQDVLAYARKQADTLEGDMNWIPVEAGAYGGYWQATDPVMKSQITARATAALEFFRQYAGGDSFWTRQAVAAYDNRGDRQSQESGARAIGDLLRAWADQVDAGITEISGARAWAEIGIASTDVMSQVRRLLDEANVHPSAAIVLCGAALEISLRAVAEARNLELPARPSISSLTRLLRSAGLFTVQDVKDLEQMGGMRNQAAHGQFDDLSLERASLMEQQTNVMLRRLADIAIGS